MVLPSEASPVQRSRAGSSGDFGRPSGDERARVPMSSAPAKPSGLDFENVGSCGVSEQSGQAFSSALAEPSECEQVSGAISNAPAESSVLAFCDWLRRLPEARPERHQIEPPGVGILDSGAETRKSLNRASW